MIIFKICIPEKVRNSQTTSKNFFRRCILDFLQSLHLRNFLKQAEKVKGIFFEGLLMIFFFKIYTPKKV